MTRLTGDVNHLRLELDGHVRELERRLQVRFVVLSVLIIGHCRLILRAQMIREKQELEAKVAELVSQLAAANS